MVPTNRCRTSNSAHRFGGAVLLSDGDGLYFRKQTREGAAWMFRYRFAGRERWMTLGNFPDMSLATARTEAREKRLMLDKRRDPLFAKQEVEEAQRAAIAAQKARQTFRDLAEDWYVTEIDPRPLKHPKVPRRYLDTAATAALCYGTGCKLYPTQAGQLVVIFSLGDVQPIYPIISVYGIDVEEKTRELDTLATQTGS
jgi:hypothetical protein